MQLSATNGTKKTIEDLEKAALHLKRAVRRIREINMGTYNKSDPIVFNGNTCPELQELVNKISEAAKALNDPDTYDKNSVWKQVREQLDQISKESLSLPENFGDKIADEVTGVITECNYDVTKEVVLETLLWCYMAKMQ